MSGKEKNLTAMLRWAIFPILAVAAVLCVFTGVSNLENGRTDEGRTRLEDAVRKAAVTCYATEGIYPPTLAYMEEHYGLQVDTGRYTVDYTVCGSNLMPEITVLENEG